MKELNLTELFFLLSFDPRNGKMTGSFLRIQKYSLACAMLADLVSLGKIQLRDGEVVSIDNVVAGDTVLQTALTEINNTKKNKKLNHWVQKLGWGFKFEKTLRDRMLEKNILRENDADGSYGWDSGDRYCWWYQQPLNTIKGRLREAVSCDREITDANILLLLTLVYKSGLTRTVFDGVQEHRQLKKDLKEIARQNDYGEAINKVLKNQGLSLGSTLLTLAGSLSELIFK